MMPQSESWERVEGNLGHGLIQEFHVSPSMYVNFREGLSLCAVMVTMQHLIG